VVAVIQHTPYHSLQDSPWYAAVSAGDSLKFGDQFCNFPATTLPDGLGVHDDFEDNDCLSPWLSIIEGNIVKGASVDADDGSINHAPTGNCLTQLINPTAQRFEARLQFIATSDGKYPQWMGFAVTGLGPTPPDESMDLLGINGEVFATIDLNALMGNYLDARLTDDDVFVGFIADQPITGVLFRDGGILLDHFQYGYGAAPMPEPAVSGLALAGAAICLRRRRTPAPA
jgi:hypothetical protein